jgi:hypothetical protein
LGKASTSFLKKRSKKLLLAWACGVPAQKYQLQIGKVFLVPFARKKNGVFV